MHMPTDVDENSHYLHRPVIKGNIAFQHVTFQYQSNTLPILKKINFQIRSGEKVAIIGRVGSGKTTIAKLILRLYEPTDGTILIDGTDYRQINPDDLRDQIGFVSQDVSLFYGSVRDNITIGTPFVDDATLLNVANISGVDNITSKHPDGFDRQIGEKGAELSGGQRQSIAIARALIKRPQLLVLDEPTSAMDDTSEKRFKQHLLNYLTPTHTLVLVTHKLSMLELVDRIIVIDEGNIVADGDKESVLHALRAGLSKDKVS
jgi:ATP-binding cassette subfamily C protein LapB